MNEVGWLSNPFLNVHIIPRNVSAYYKPLMVARLSGLSLRLSTWFASGGYWHLWFIRCQARKSPMAPSELVLTWSWTGCRDFQAHVHAALARHCMTTLGGFLWRFQSPVNCGIQSVVMKVVKHGGRQL